MHCPRHCLSTISDEKDDGGISFLRLFNVPFARDETAPRVNAGLPGTWSCVVYGGVGDEGKNEEVDRSESGRKRERTWQWRSHRRSFYEYAWLFRCCRALLPICHTPWHYLILLIKQYYARAYAPVDSSSSPPVPLAPHPSFSFLFVTARCNYAAL